MRGKAIHANQNGYNFSNLRRFIRDKKLPWPQHFDGKGWENRFAQQFGIFGIPTAWLVNRRGDLTYTETRGNVMNLVGALVAQEP